MKLLSPIESILFIQVNCVFSLRLVVTRMFKAQDCFILSNDNLETMDGTAVSLACTAQTQK